MAAKKQIVEEREGYRFVWTLDIDKDPSVKVYLVEHGPGAEPFMEWGYPSTKRGLAANVDLWRDQALLQARAEAKGA